MNGIVNIKNRGHDSCRIGTKFIETKEWFTWYMTTSGKMTVWGKQTIDNYAFGRVPHFMNNIRWFYLE